MKVTFYRAAAPGLRQVVGLTSWTTSRAHAHEYTDRFLPHVGGRVLYHADVDVREDVLLDLRVHPREVLLDAGLVDLDDYEHEAPQDLYRALAALFRAHSYDWVAFLERPENTYDEWLYVGSTALLVEAETDPTRTRECGET